MRSSPLRSADADADADAVLSQTRPNLWGTWAPGHLGTRARPRSQVWCSVSRLTTIRKFPCFAGPRLVTHAYVRGRRANLSRVTPEVNHHPNRQGQPTRACFGGPSLWDFLSVCGLTTTCMVNQPSREQSYLTSDEEPRGSNPVRKGKRPWPCACATAGGSPPLRGTSGTGTLTELRLTELGHIKEVLRFWWLPGEPIRLNS